ARSAQGGCSEWILHGDRDRLQKVICLDGRQERKGQQARAQFFLHSATYPLQGRDRERRPANSPPMSWRKCADCQKRFKFGQHQCREVAGQTVSRSLTCYVSLN